MKTIKMTDLGTLKNELNKYRKGKKFDINQFNQIARLAWLGKIVMQPLDPLAEDVKSYLLYADFPDPVNDQVLATDEDLIGRMHIVDAEQGEALAKILEEGFKERLALAQALRARDFYFSKFYGKKDKARGDEGE
ncbi:hypothetical protein HUS23_12455 [Ectothiorhodospiraceae bacterium 2226]|nr:hypothetical protein HUS23_12455 [Ectothiorhodospiraceae bacterium 2226]